MAFYEPDVEKRLRAEGAEIMARYPEGHQRSALLPMLHLVQSEDGYVSSNGIALCADMLGLTHAEVSAVATFYTQYKRKPNGEFTVGVCTNAMCAVMGGDEIFNTLKKHLNVGNDETTPDGKITLEALECNAACDYAPVVMVNWEFFDNQTPQSATKLVDDIRAGKDVTPTRGPNKVATFKEVSHILAGFVEPDLANQGVSAGESSLTGLNVAKERGWSCEAAEEGPFRPSQMTTTTAGTEQVGTKGSSAEKPGELAADENTTNDDQKGAQ